MENKYRFRDSSLSFDERVKDLLSRLTIKEKAGTGSYLYDGTAYEVKVVVERVTWQSSQKTL